MITKIDGIILSKVPFKDRHAVCHILRRNGKKISVLFYGGLGGGKKKSSSILELGSALKLELYHHRSTDHLYKSREWSPLWRHENIRRQYRSFTHLCFYLEFLQKVAVSDDLSDEDQRCKNTGSLFSVGSNAIFFLEKSCVDRHYNPYFASTLFLSKLLIAEGLFPEIHNCIVTGEKIAQKMQCLLLNDLGGFAMTHSLGRSPSSTYNGETHLMLRSFLHNTSLLNYQTIEENRPLETSCFYLLLDYCLYQFHLTQKRFKTLGTLI